ncbi:hypothetical protein LGQ03_15160 [Loktanella sp. TSTF-M6]|uniref:Autotransporter domain-containing protein n=1 Tax=Loktanella gaetbuli TaxID=2881335 RepID=A0ABS8BYC3_9RHOB|nr:hypothetical protein [Loktanella gaetbuli]MCB5200579.1 hypothetical protein [Loktanella gaetbuli]
MTDNSNLRQTGIRQKSLAGHCRLGRATALVLTFATGAVVTLGVSHADAQTLTWDIVSGDGATVTSGDGTWDDERTVENWNDGTGSVGFRPFDDVVIRDSNAAPGFTITVDDQGGDGIVRAGDVFVRAADVTITGPSQLALEALRVAPGAFVVLDGIEIAGTLNLSGSGLIDLGDVSVTGNLASAGQDVFQFGDVDVSGVTQIRGDYLIDGGATLTTRGVNVSNNALFVASGDIIGTVTSFGRTFIAGDVDGAVNVRDGQTVFDGDSTVAGVRVFMDTMTVADGATLTTIGGARVSDGGRGIIDGTMVSDLQNIGDLNVSGTLDGDVENTGLIKLSGVIDGDIFNSGEIRVEGGSAGLLGDIDNRGPGRIDIRDGAVVAGGSINNVYGNLSIAGTYNGDVMNARTVQLDGGTIGGDYTSANLGSSNSAVLAASGQTRIGGDVNGAGIIDMRGRGTTDNITIGGAITGSNTFNLDVNTSAAAPNVDTITLESPGDVSAVQTLNFVNAGTGLQTDPVDVVIGDGGTVDPDDFEVGLQALPGGTTVTALTQNGDNLAYTVSVTPAVGGVIGGVAATNALIGSIVNRPASAFVTQSATQAADTCGRGLWARAISGEADGTVTTTDSLGQTDNDVNITYGGVTLGRDVACVQGGPGGFDLVMGGQVSAVTGQSSVPVDAIGSVAASTTATDFDQLSFGAYVAATKGSLLIDGQLTGTRTNSEISNSAVSLNDSEFSVSGLGVSLAARYFYALPQEGWAIIPSAGVSVERMQFSNLGFGDGSTLSLDDHTRTLAYVGGTVQKTINSPSGDSQQRFRGTVSLFDDLSDDQVGTFTLANGGGTETLSTGNLGSFTEASFGYTFSQLFNDGPVDQIDQQIRIDGRFGDNVDSYGITAEVRFHF